MTTWARAYFISDAHQQNRRMASPIWNLFQRAPSVNDRSGIIFLLGMVDCLVGTFYWLQPTDGSCCKERNMQLSQNLGHYAFSFWNQFVPSISVYAKFSHILVLCSWKKGKVKSCVVCKRERWHLWCRTLMHIDRVSTKSHDMLTMQLCIGSVFWLHRVGH